MYEYHILLVILGINNTVLTETGLFDAKKDVFFQFYSKPEGDEDVQVFNTRFDPKSPGYRIDLPASFDGNKQTFMYIHGFMSSAGVEHARTFFSKIKTGLNCCNFVVVNWTVGSTTALYNMMKDRSRSVSKYQLINYLSLNSIA